jgi:hypothetical protein
MARLIDDLRATDRVEMPFWVASNKGDQWARGAELVLGVVRKEEFPVILIDNVADYYYRRSAQEYWDLTRDFPNLAPPYEMFWTEHKLPQMIHSEKFGDTKMNHVGRNARQGILWLAAQEWKAEGVPENCKWMLCAEIFTDYDCRGRGIEGPSGTWCMMVDKDGAVVAQPQIQCYADPQWNEVLSGMMTVLHPALLAVSFLHCKNVKVVENEFPKPLAKKYHARTGIWPTPFHTLVIEPLKQILQTQGGSGSNGLAKAMHICRGHFRDYREGRGLFGKYKQLVWTPAVVRGTKGEKAAPREMRIKV